MQGLYQRQPMNNGLGYKIVSAGRRLLAVAWPGAAFLSVLSMLLAVGARSAAAQAAAAQAATASANGNAQTEYSTSPDDQPSQPSHDPAAIDPAAVPPAMVAPSPAPLPSTMAGQPVGTSNHAPGAQLPGQVMENSPLRITKGDSNELQGKREDRLRRLLTGFGFTDTEVQDAVIEYIRMEEKSRTPIRRRALQLFQAMRANTVPEEQMRNIVAEFRSSVAADKIRCKAEEEKLDQKLSFSKNPRLEAFLLMTGIIGDGPMVVAMGQPPAPSNARARMAGGPAGILVSAEDQKLALDLQEALMKRFDENQDNQLDDGERRRVRRLIHDISHGREQGRWPREGTRQGTKERPTAAVREDRGPLPPGGDLEKGSLRREQEALKRDQLALQRAQETLRRDQENWRKEREELLREVQSLRQGRAGH